MALQAGDTLDRGKYRIVRQLGRGGFGFVYLAEDTLLREEVAVKELIPALVGDEVALKRFLAEAKATIRLRHERIVGTHSVFVERDNYYIAMEYMAGGSLEARLKERGALPVDEAVRVAADVAEGLAYAHEQGVVHCDLKPANILFDGKGRAKVADFGIAHVSDQMLSRSWVTPAGFVAGTLPYMSPEQADGVRGEPRIDIYALGAVLYRMLTGRPYLDFEETDSPRAQSRNVQRIEAEQPQPPSSHNRSVPVWLDAVVLRALAKRPEERYANAGELLVALTRKATAPPAPVPVPVRVEGETVVVPLPAGPAQPAAASQPPPPAVQVSPKSLPKWLWPAVGGAAALLVVVVIALIVSAAAGGRGNPTPTATRPVVAQATAALTPTSRPPVTTSAPAAATAVPRTTAPAATATPVLPSPTPAPLPTETSSSTPTATATAAPAPKLTFTVSQGPVNARSGPGTVYPIVGTLRQGETFEITGKNAAGDWWQFLFSGQLGWVSGQVVSASTAGADIPIVAAPPTPSATSANSTPSPTLQHEYSAPELFSCDAKPPQDPGSSGKISVAWAWTGPPPTANQGFEIRIWKDDQSEHYGAMPPLTHWNGVHDYPTGTTYPIGGVIDVLVWGTAAAQKGGPGHYWYTVALVQLTPYARIGPEAPPCPLTLSAKP